MEKWQGLSGLVFILLLAWIFSNNRSRINYRLVLSGLALQIALALFILKTSLGQTIFSVIAGIIQKILELADKGGEFVFGGLVKKELLIPVFGEAYSFMFFFRIIPVLIFITVLVNLAYHFGIMQRVVSLFARAVYFIMRVSGSEATSNIASIFVGQVESQIMIKPYLPTMTMSELLASMSGSMACISGGIMAVYISMGIPAAYLLTASAMAAPGALVISKIVWPETEESDTRDKVSVAVSKSETGWLGVTAQGAIDGMKVAMSIIAVLIGFIALIALVNLVLTKFGFFLNFVGIGLPGNLNLDMIFGSVFSGIAWLLGVPASDMYSAGSLLVGSRRGWSMSTTQRATSGRRKTRCRFQRTILHLRKRTGKSM